MASIPPKVVKGGCASHHRSQPTRAMFEREAWLMMLPLAMIVLGLLAALIVPIFFGRARIGAACQHEGGTWIVGHGCEIQRGASP